jgi:hypothetical protein
MATMATSRTPAELPRTFSIKLATLEDDRVLLAIEDGAGRPIIHTTELTLEEAIRMVRLQIVKNAYPVRSHDRLLRGG